MVANILIIFANILTSRSDLVGKVVMSVGCMVANSLIIFAHILISQFDLVDECRLPTAPPPPSSPACCNRPAQSPSKLQCKSSKQNAPKN